VIPCSSNSSSPSSSPFCGSSREEGRARRCEAARWLQQMEPAVAEFLPERSLLGRAAGGLTGRARVTVPEPRTLGSRARWGAAPVPRRAARGQARAPSAPLLRGPRPRRLEGGRGRWSRRRAAHSRSLRPHVRRLELRRRRRRTQTLAPYTMLFFVLLVCCPYWHQHHHIYYSILQVGPLTLSYLHQHELSFFFL
jgi:hypothetical protein